MPPCHSTRHSSQGHLEWATEILGEELVCVFADLVLHWLLVCFSVIKVWAYTAILDELYKHWFLGSLGVLDPGDSYLVVQPFVLLLKISGSAPCYRWCQSALMKELTAYAWSVNPLLSEVRVSNSFNSWQLWLAQRETAPWKALTGVSNCWKK